MSGLRDITAKLKKDVERCKHEYSEAYEESQGDDYNDWGEINETMGYWSGRQEGVEHVLKLLSDYDDSLDDIIIGDYVEPIYGVSTGDTGQYGVGEIFEGNIKNKTRDGELLLDGEPVYYYFKIVDSEIVHIKEDE
jgi:hypothetical protein